MFGELAIGAVQFLGSKMRGDGGMGGHTAEARAAVLARLRLEEAAPELYDALVRAVTPYRSLPAGHRPSWYDAAEAAIAKANEPA